MTVDIFQYSNMYTLRKSVQWLADEAHVKEECGPYVIKEGMANKLLRVPHLQPLVIQEEESRIGPSFFICTRA